MTPSELDLPDRVVVGANGAYWRDFGDSYSMCPVSTDNDPVEPVAVYVRDVASLDAAYRLALRQIEHDGEVKNRLTTALRVATHRPHDQDGAPVEGFPACSVCGAIQTDPDPLPSEPDLAALREAAQDVLDLVIDGATPEGDDSTPLYDLLDERAAAIADRLRAALAAATPTAPALDAEAAEAILTAAILSNGIPHVGHNQLCHEADAKIVHAALSPAPTTEDEPHE